MVKLVYCARRKAGLSREEFQRYWLEDHAILATSLREYLPPMIRYVQSHTIDSAAGDAMAAARGNGEPYDGITEVWFEDLDNVGNRPSPEALDVGRRILEDENKFVDAARSCMFITVEHEIF